MATINLANPTFYIDGVGGVSAVVGYEIYGNRVARYEFTTNLSGASGVSLEFNNNWPGEYGNPRVRFFIGVDPDSHANAGGDSYQYTGELTSRIEQGYIHYSGSADVLLMPNTKYYLWLFPANQEIKYTYWNTASDAAILQTTGGSISTISPQTGILGSTFNINVTRHVGTFTHTIKYSIGNQSGTICEKSASLSINWTPSLELARQITTAETGVASVEITTYNGNVAVGSTSVPFTLIVPGNIVPTVSVEWEDRSRADEEFGVLTQNVSFLSVSTSAAGAYGSQIKNTAVYIDEKEYSGGIITTAGSVTLRAVTTDSRGRTGTETISLNVHEYSSPQITVSASRCDQDGTPNDIGEYALIKMSLKTSNVNGRNSATVSLTYGNYHDTITAGAGEVEVTRIVAAPSVSSLRISAYVQDKINTSGLSTMILSVGYATMDFLRGGKGIAFGTTATQEGFTCAMYARFLGGVEGVTPTIQRKVINLRDYTLSWTQSAGGMYYATIGTREALGLSGRTVVGIYVGGMSGLSAASLIMPYVGTSSVGVYATAIPTVTAYEITITYF